MPGSVAVARRRIVTPAAGFASPVGTAPASAPCRNGQRKARLIAARAPGEIPAAITPIVVPDGLLVRADVLLVMERRSRGSAR
ncbi:hypothetical protein GCM10017566_24630 [Amycolatopsis bartoniae]|uniref:Uncharacterized protein n=1 Tax=Amycolatopsis bartoniae TaxID=941986 RepID=A0A8H9ITG3_9PSEU|nr:hypothetical protein GCM10017566_24630 [Amycolatopsis bartoniae]